MICVGVCVCVHVCMYTCVCGAWSMSTRACVYTFIWLHVCLNTQNESEMTWKSESKQQTAQYKPTNEREEKKKKEKKSFSSDFWHETRKRQKSHELKKKIRQDFSSLISPTPATNRFRKLITPNYFDGESKWRRSWAGRRVRVSRDKWYLSFSRGYQKKLSSYDNNPKISFWVKQKQGEKSSRFQWGRKRRTERERDRRLVEQGRHRQGRNAYKSKINQENNKKSINKRKETGKER